MNWLFAIMQIFGDFPPFRVAGKCQKQIRLSKFGLHPDNSVARSMDFTENLKIKSLLCQMVSSCHWLYYYFGPLCQLLAGVGCAVYNRDADSPPSDRHQLSIAEIIFCYGV